MTDPFESIRLNADGTRKSYKWYQSKINQLTSSNKFDVSDIMNNEKQLVNTINPGNMYLFYYDPKHKATLPIYDTMPLVLPFRAVSDGFYGINLHYLPYMLRFRLLQSLTKLKSNNTITENSKINLSWKIINSTSTLLPARDAVKRYLSNHVRSRYLKINMNDWITASQLPLENFVYQNKSKSIKRK